MRHLLLLTAMSLSASGAIADTSSTEAGTSQAPTFNQVDTDQDGAVSRLEAASFSAVEITFDAADANQDNQLDPDEYARIGGTQPR